MSKGFQDLLKKVYECDRKTVAGCLTLLFDTIS